MSENVETLVNVSPPKSGQEPEETSVLSQTEQEAVRGLGSPGTGQRSGPDRRR